VLDANTINDPTNEQWNVAHQLASDLIKNIPTDNDKVSDSEVRQVLNYLRISLSKNPDNAAANFFELISNLTIAAKELNKREQRNQGGNRNRTKKTAEKYQAVSDCCTRGLDAFKSDAQGMLTILTWAIRLMKYYHQASVGEGRDESIKLTLVSERQAEIAQVLTNKQFEIDQEIEAVVMSISGNMVCYEIMGIIRLTKKEPKMAAMLTQNQMVMVKVVALKEDGGIKSVKWSS
jgi:hypothetical protein